MRVLLYATRWHLTVNNEDLYRNRIDVSKSL